MFNMPFFFFFSSYSNKKSKCFVPFLSFGFVFYVIGTLGALMYIFFGLYMFGAIVLLAFLLWIIIFTLQTPFLLCVYSHYTDVKNGEIEAEGAGVRRDDMPMDKGHGIYPKV